MKARMMIFAQLWLGREEPAKLRATHANDTPVATHPAADQNLAIVKQIKLAGEIPFAVHRKHFQPSGSVLVNFNAPAQHDKKIHRAIAPLE